MNSQLHPDARLDQILTALRTTDPPTGLEARVAQRLAAHRAQARTQATAAPSFFAVLVNNIKDARISLVPAQLYAAAALTLLVTLTTLTLLHNHASTTTQSQLIAFRATEPTRTSSPAQIAATNPQNPRVASLAATSSSSALLPRVLNPEINSASAKDPVPRGFSLGSHSLLRAEGVLTPTSTQAQDPDQLALAETLAPSRPAPPMPLTAQEKTLVASTRPGQPIQLAELDAARAPIFRAEAEARHNANIQRYVKSLLAPFAVADALQPTKYSEPREISTNASAPPPPISSTN